MLYRVAWFMPDDNPDTNQWPIDPSSRPAAHGGAGYMITLGALEIDLIRRVNSSDPDFTWERKKQWACHENAGYLYVGNKDGNSWKWPMVIMGSGGINKQKYNVVDVTTSERGKRKINAIPVLMSYDHLSPETHPHLFHRVITTNNSGDWDTPVGVFYMPLFSAQGRRHPRGELTGAWIRSAYVGDALDTPPVDPPSENQVIVIRRTVLRQGPSAGTNKLGVAKAGEVLIVLQTVNGWGLTTRGYVNLQDTKPA